MFSPIWGKGNGRGISGFAVNWGAVNRGFTVVPKTLKLFATLPINLEIQNTGGLWKKSVSRLMIKSE